MIGTGSLARQVMLARTWELLGVTERTLAAAASAAGIYDEGKAQGQTCALGPWPRDARLGELLPSLQDSYHLAGHPVFTFACPWCRGSRDEWGSMVNVPRGIALRPIQGPPASNTLAEDLFQAAPLMFVMQSSDKILQNYLGHQCRQTQRIIPGLATVLGTRHPRTTNTLTSHRYSIRRHATTAWPGHPSSGPRRPIGYLQPPATPMLTITATSPRQDAEEQWQEAAGGCGGNECWSLVVNM
ncbi:hypothetical protein E2C01_066626 [Portunus trituberculatus]|uniref:Uncharacterized protein n=1 Tax=Portunus trituberculatus TaxID=210409 RepID=A0A5B7HV70_PORTR|nr:hypothetical protein [Portunus trituberculatus]